MAPTFQLSLLSWNHLRNSSGPSLDRLKKLISFLPIEDKAVMEQGKNGQIRSEMTPIFNEHTTVRN